jgi:hypothetical protein
VRNNPHSILPFFRQIAGIPSFDLPGLDAAARRLPRFGGTRLTAP